MKNGISFKQENIEIKITTKISLFGRHDAAFQATMHYL